MNIPFIHVFELVTLLLVLMTCIQVRKLYLQAMTLKKVPVSQRQALRNKTVSNQVQLSKLRQSPAQKIFQEATCGYSRNNLPLPDVSFDNGLPLAEVSYVDDRQIDLATEPDHNHKQLLDSYIDDMFFESSNEFVETPTSVATKKPELSDVNKDEFITVAQENAQLVIELEILNKRAVFTR